jgi:hypothetical protein
MTSLRIATLVAAMIGSAASAHAQAVKLEFHDGKVNLTTQNASLRAILAEWSRLGGTQVVNAERLAGPPVTLQLTDIAETQALDIILRGTAGYIAGARPATSPVGTRSALDRIMVVPTAGTAVSAGARPASVPPPFTVTPPPQFRQIDPDDNPVSDTPPDDDPPNRGRGPVNVPRAGPVQAPPQPFQPQDDQPQQPTNTAPANPFGIQTGSPRPGTITPVPPQPQRPRTQPDPEP